MRGSVIEIKELSKTYSTKGKSKLILDNIAIKIDKGEKVGILGPNGSGKSTLIKIIAGIIYPTSGTIKVLGKNPNKDRKELSKRNSILFGQRSILWPFNTIRDNLELYKKMYSVPDELYDERVKYFTDQLELAELIDKTPLEMSLGQKMRCQLAASLIHYPELIILDEATIGLDLVIRQQFMVLLNQIHAKVNNVIIISSHNLMDLKFCDKIIVMVKGKVIYQGSLDKVKSLIPNLNKIMVGVKEDIDISLKDELIKINGINEVIINKSKIDILFDEEIVNYNKILKIIMNKNTIINVKESSIDYEEVFIKLYAQEGE